MPKLRDYLAANAPAVPTWYNPIFEYPSPPKKPKHPTHFSTEEMKSLYFGWVNDPCWDLNEPEFALISNEWITYWQLETNYTKQKKEDYRIFKIISWRYFYADQMIELRKKHSPKPFWLKHPFFAVLFLILLAICYLISAYLENSYAIL